MPNWVDVKLTLTGDPHEIEHFLTDCGAPNGIDFTKPYPCPKDLLDVRSPVTIVDDAEYQSAVKDATSCVGAKYLPLTTELRDKYRELYGSDNWLDWCCANWGTKWPPLGVSAVEGQENVFEFETASSYASGLWKGLSRLYPGITFHTAFSDGMAEYWGFQVSERGTITAYEIHEDDDIEGEDGSS